MKAGDRVKAKPGGGLSLAAVPFTGEQHQDLGVSPGVLMVGTVEEVRPLVTDYDTWDDLYEGVGVIESEQVLVRTDKGVIGWASEGALVAEEE